MIVVSDSSPLITLARAHQLELLCEFYLRVAIPRKVYEEWWSWAQGCPEPTKFGARPGFKYTRIHQTLSKFVQAACAGLGGGEQRAIYLASALRADLVLIDEERARRVAKTAGLTVAGSIAILERGARLHKIEDLLLVYQGLIEQGIRFDHRLLEESLARLGLGKLKP